MRKQKGFTLIELLVVIAVIGILASIVLAAVSTAEAKARDTRRISDLKQLQTALELYYTDHGAYPGNGHYTTSTNCLIAAGQPVWTTLFDSTFQSKYMSQLPVDPKGSSNPSYCYDYDSYPYAGTNNYTGWTCTLPDGTVVDPDGNNGATKTGNGYWYMLVFKSETDLSATYPKFLGDSRSYCIFGPPHP